MKKLLFILMSVLAFLGVSTVCAQEAYTKITSANELVENGVYLIASAECGMAMGMPFTNNTARERVAVTIAGGVISTEVATVATDKKPYEIVLKKNGEQWALYDAVNQKYIARVSDDSKNQIQNQDDPYGWSITIDANGNADILGSEGTPRRILYNNKGGQERFAAYKQVTETTGNVVQLYKKGGTYVDETAPEISFVVTNATTNTEVEVHFSEALDQASAETVANYTINNSIAVSAAKLGEDGKTVTLTTSAMTEGTAYELTVNGVKDAAGNATENLKYSFTFGAIEVDDIAAVLALRDSYVNAQQYRIKGEVVVVAHVGTSIYVQDKNCPTTKGHSLLLYDQPKTYADRFPAGTVLTKVAGSLTIYNNALFEMQYLADDITENGTAEVVVTPATIAEVYRDNLYHAALVRFSDVVFSSDDQGGTFKSGNYRIQDPSGKYMELHVYASDNIVGETVPSEKVSITGYVGVYGGNSQLILRDKSDISTSTAVENNEAIRFSVYPNPTDGLLNVETEGNFRVSVYSFNGVSLIRRNACEKVQLDLSGLNQGVYIVEISTDKGNAYTKVVVR